MSTPCFTCKLPDRNKLALCMVVQLPAACLEAPTRAMSFPSRNCEGVFHIVLLYW